MTSPGRIKKYYVTHLLIWQDDGVVWCREVIKVIITQVSHRFLYRKYKFYYIHQQEVLFFYFVFVFNYLDTIGSVNASLRSNYDNCLHDSAVSIKLNLLLAMMWFLYVVKLARGRVFGWIPWLKCRSVVIIIKRNFLPSYLPQCVNNDLINLIHFVKL